MEHKACDYSKIHSSSVTLQKSNSICGTIQTKMLCGSSYKFIIWNGDCSVSQLLKFGFSTFGIFTLVCEIHKLVKGLVRNTIHIRIHYDIILFWVDGESLPLSSFISPVTQIFFLSCFQEKLFLENPYKIICSVRSKKKKLNFQQYYHLRLYL